MFISKTVIVLLCCIASLIGVIIYLLFSANRSTKKKQELLTDFKLLESKISAIELDGLKYKIEPHLFKNILNSIQSHAYQTYFSLDKLSNVLDYILYETDKQFVTIKEELDFAMNLIEINKLKLSPLFDLKIKNRINDSHPFYNQELLAPMVTIDLIENAFKHADIQNGDSFISITFELKDDFFALTVANKISTKPALKKNNSGIGTESMKKRLDIIYKGCYVLEQFEENDVFISHLKLNLLDYKAKVLAVG
jgi:LytS/YehU family sensor histidine kinase